MKHKNHKSLREVRSSVNAKPTNIQKKATEKKETTPKEKKGPSTEEVKTARRKRKSEAKSINDINAIIARRTAELEKLEEDGKKESRRSRKDYGKALRRARRTRQKLAKLNAAKKEMSVEKTYDVMVQYDSKMYPQVKELINEMNLKTNITTETYFYIKIVDQKSLDEIKEKFGKIKFEIMTKRRKVDDNGNPVMIKCKHADGTEYEKVDTYLVPTGKCLTVHIHASKHANYNIRKEEKKKKPTHNTTARKAAVVGKHIALKQQRKTLAEWRKLMKAKRDGKQKEKEAKKKVNEQKKSITKAA